MIWATAGFPFAVNEAATFGKAGESSGGVEHALLPLYEQAWRALEAANIAVYPLDVSELTNPGYASAGMGEAAPQHVIDGHARGKSGEFRGRDRRKILRPEHGRNEMF